MGGGRELASHRAKARGGGGGWVTARARGGWFHVCGAPGRGGRGPAGARSVDAFLALLIE
jgi:hypothetical protein